MFKEVHLKRAAIETKENEIRQLKDSLASLTVSLNAPVLGKGTVSSSSALTQPAGTNVKSPEGIVGSNIRRTISTPGGTKRKGIQTSDILTINA